MASEQDMVTGNRFDADQFRTENRIHMKYGSRFTQDHYIVVHPREMHPENESRLAAKFIKHYTIPTISFFNFNPRGQVAAQLATLVPVSYEAKQQSLSKRLLDVYTESKTGQDKETAELSGKREAPFDSMVRNYLETADHDPEQREYTTNALAIYLLMNEALSLRGYHKEASSYVRNPVDVDTILAQLSPLLDVKPNEVVKAAAD
ncbi:MAG: hypothetical protein MRY32_00700, partial [Rickettsiales bacterium]|nr:hypothetical protein [Rickettsiales bacterium]